MGHRAHLPVTKFLGSGPVLQSNRTIRRLDLFHHAPSKVRCNLARVPTLTSPRGRPKLEGGAIGPRAKVGLAIGPAGCGRWKEPGATRTTPLDLGCDTVPNVQLSGLMPNHNPDPCLFSLQEPNRERTVYRVLTMYSEHHGHLADDQRDKGVRSNCLRSTYSAPAPRGLYAVYGDGHLSRRNSEFSFVSSCQQHAELVRMVVRQLEAAGLPLLASILLDHPPHRPTLMHAADTRN